MMLRWKTADLGATTIDQIEEVTIMAHYGNDADGDFYAATLLENISEAANKGEFIQEYNYRKRGHINTIYNFDDMRESRIFVLVRSRLGGIPTVYDITCCMGWILDDDGNTIDKLCC